ncbi:outer membrane protein assembly factor BamD [Flavobacterium sp. LMO8]|uniref:outer membrane protein assembly factor BamD n=1 Tax=Flavobacterium sp. LMO8 TaxID=2654244 RepID=UPI0012909919|nr:outer membrane protein assembly factor BamD [Flavobacterium sp. LMO8]MQP23688.1 outer membrane protein assembly factor BamD [Flavobacterium sp. LMO8]
MNKIISFLLIATILISCGEYQKALKSDDVAFKAEVANKKYEVNKYAKAIRLYEQIAPAYKGKPNAERLFYFYSMSLYKSEEYYLAGYQLENFVSSYPKSEKREEAAFYSAECFYKLSPEYSLDQTDTNKALDKMQKFIDNYPNSEFLPKANICVKELREKQEKKAFEIAKQYHTIAEYRLEYNAALKALDNFISDYPGTPYKEEAMFLKFDTAYNFAKNSIVAKRADRYASAKIAYNNLIKFKPTTKYKEEADKLLASIEQELKQFSK